MRILRWILLLAGLLVVVAIALGRIGLLAGDPPTGIGVHDGRLAAPATTPNSVSSQANLYPDHPQMQYARIEPLRFSGDGVTAMGKLAAVIRGMDGATIIEERPDYIQAQFETALMRFNDDAEFWLDNAAGVIQVRSASRIGKSDLGVNRKRIETIRTQMNR
jgi:uncharacterized protein (DUF1499 family)